MTAPPALKSPEEFLADGHTPMMAQYHAVKQSHPGCLLFYRMGDFYELFFEDAITAAAALDLTLTKRGKTQGDEIPMCGVPVHAHEAYLARLIRQGFRVAICEQTETPEEAKKRGGAKALVQRDVIRVVTQGTLTEDSLLDARESNWLAALVEARGVLGLSWLDLSTGAFFTQSVSGRDVGAALERISPGELLIPEGMAETEALHPLRSRLTVEPAPRFHVENARGRLQDAFGVATLDAFGEFSPAEVAAAGALVDYVARTQKGKLPRLSRPVRIAPESVLEIDAATRRNLELTRSFAGGKAGTLLAAIDRTVTGAGARLLQARLSAPVRDLPEILLRQEEIAAFLADPALRDTVRVALRQTPDMERALARLTLGRGGPRDLVALRSGLAAAEMLRGRLLALGNAALERICEGLRLPASALALIDHLTAALDDEPPVMARDGGFIRKGYDPRLDELRALSSEGRRMIAALQARYAQETGIESLKISHNAILGYYIEVPAKRAAALLPSPGAGQSDLPFIHRQTMANAVRFTTVELAAMERDMASASDKALAIEQSHFAALTAEATAAGDDISRAAGALAALDVAAGLADLAADLDWQRPVLCEDLSFDVRGGRHPVVEQGLRSSPGSGAFVPNDCNLEDTQRLWLLTGPNMAGKSTFLRQNALIVILAQMGSYIPAKSARIGLVDRLFSRVGAADDLARGRSTFMVEMVETAMILNQASERSLVILDEIGRGTATFDGLSIAWACVEHLHEVTRCRGLFATHYHELTRLEAQLASLSCHSMQVREWQGDVVFLHEVAAGAADRSYGVHVARLAGLPDAVVARAEALLDMLTAGESSDVLSKLTNDLPLFSAASAPRPAPLPSKPNPALERLAALDPDSLTPRDALEALYTLKRLAAGD